MENHRTLTSANQLEVRVILNLAREVWKFVELYYYYYFKYIFEAESIASVGIVYGFKTLAVILENACSRRVFRRCISREQKHTKDELDINEFGSTKDVRTHAHTHRHKFVAGTYIHPMFLHK